jgi:hypothetical protein
VVFRYVVENNRPGGDWQQPLIKVYNDLLKLRLSRSALTFDGAGVIFFRVIPQSMISGSLVITAWRVLRLWISWARLEIRRVNPNILNGHERLPTGVLGGLEIIGVLQRVTQGLGLKWTRGVYL